MQVGADHESVSILASGDMVRAPSWGVLIPILVLRSQGEQWRTLRWKIYGVHFETSLAVSVAGPTRRQRDRITLASPEKEGLYRIKGTGGTDVGELERARLPVLPIMSIGCLS